MSYIEKMEVAELTQEHLRDEIIIQIVALAK